MRIEKVLAMASHESVQNTSMPGWRSEPDAFKQPLVNMSQQHPHGTIAMCPMQLVAVGYSGDLNAPVTGMFLFLKYWQRV